jgi:transposase
MKKKNKTYSAEFKRDIVHMYLHEGWSQSELLKHIRIHNSMLQRWVNQYQSEGIEGLLEKRGKSKGSKKGRPRKKSVKFRGENETLRSRKCILKKVLGFEKGEDSTKEKSIEFLIIHKLRTQFPVVLLCEIAEVSAGGYYKWLKRQTDPSKKHLETKQPYPNRI